MTRALYWIGLANAALWWGGSVFFTLGIAPAVFSPEMRRMFAAPSSVGYIAQIMQERYFFFGSACGFVAVFVAAAEWGLLQRRLSRWLCGLLGGLLVFYLASEFFLVPMMRNLHETRHFGRTQAARARAVRVFGMWHGASQAGNMAALAALTLWLRHRALSDPSKSPKTGG